MDSIPVGLLLLITCGVFFDCAGFKGRALADHHHQQQQQQQPRSSSRRCSPSPQQQVAGDDFEEQDSNPGPTGCDSLGTEENNGGTRGPVPSGGTASQQLTSDQWQVRIRKKQTRIFAIQHEILDRLGLRRRPNVTSTNLTGEEQERFEELLRQTETQDRAIYQRDFYAKRYQTIMPLCTLPRNSDSSWTDEKSKEMRLYFSVEPIEMIGRHRETRLTVANLRLRRKTITDDVKTTGRSSSGVNEDAVIRISVYAYTRPIKWNRKESKKLISSQLMNRNSVLTWMRLDIRGAVEDWMRRPQRNYGLKVTVEVNNQTMNPYDIFERINCSSSSSSSSPVAGSPPVLGFPTSSSGSGAQPDMHEDPTDPAVVLGGNATTLPAIFLDVVTVDAPRRSRSGRGSRDLQSFSQRTYCSLEKMFVSFADLGWSDWIVQPKGFETGFCRGSCSKRTGTRTVNGKFTADLKSLGLSECCGPVRAKSLSVLHYSDRNRLSISVFDDFIVSECGCRR